jgi:hypothetical protein
VPGTGSGNLGSNEIKAQKWRWFCKHLYYAAGSGTVSVSIYFLLLEASDKDENGVDIKCVQ